MKILFARPALLGLGLLALGAAASPQGWQAPAEAKARANPVPSSPEALRKGKALYQKHCASCHGDKGKGDGPASRFGPGTPEDLTDPEVQERLSDGEAFWKITQGRKEGGDVVMPAFEKEIPSAEDRWKLVLFIRTLNEARNVP